MFMLCRSIFTNFIVPFKVLSRWSDSTNTGLISDKGIFCVYTKIDPQGPDLIPFSVD